MVEAIVPGVGGVPVNPYETIPTELAKKYADLMKDIQAIFERTPLDQDDARELQDLMQKLGNLAKEGFQGKDGYHYFLSRSMLQQMNTVFSMLESAGITPNNAINPSFVDAMKFLQTYKYDRMDGSGKTFTFSDLLDVGGIANETKNLEEMIKTDLLDYGTKMFDKKLDELMKTLEITKATLDVLKVLQDILNQVKIPTPSDFNIPVTSIKDIPPDLAYKIAKRMGLEWDKDGKPIKGNAFLAAYNRPYNEKDTEAIDTLNKWLGEGDNALTYIKDSKEYFEQVIKPVPYLKDDTVEDLLAYRKELKALLAKLKEMDPEGLTKEGSLASSVQKVVDGLDEAFQSFDAEQENYPNGDLNNPNNILYTKSREAALAWILDGRDKVGGTSGNNQDLLSKAITAGENLNDETKDKFTQVKSTYDNFMKMAAAMIEGLKKVIDRFAQGTAR